MEQPKLVEKVSVDKQAVAWTFAQDDTALNASAVLVSADYGYESWAVEMHAFNFPNTNGEDEFVRGFWGSIGAARAAVQSFLVYAIGETPNE